MVDTKKEIDKYPSINMAAEKMDNTEVRPSEAEHNMTDTDIAILSPLAHPTLAAKTYRELNIKDESPTLPYILTSRQEKKKERRKLAT